MLDIADSGQKKELRELSPLLLHASSLDLQQQREEVLVVHGPRGPASLVLQPTLGLQGATVRVGGGDGLMFDLVI